MQSAQITALLFTYNRHRPIHTSYTSIRPILTTGICLVDCCPQTAYACSPAISLTAVNVCYFVFSFLFFSSFSDLYPFRFACCTRFKRVLFSSLDLLPLLPPPVLFLDLPSSIPIPGLSFLWGEKKRKEKKKKLST
ncbi:hypothetical protein HOY80DRAFT_253076 [Tuber brumale]|nr:hypothetical protein HOY80DRAFT_253076 [Tuber brumale]